MQCVMQKFHFNCLSTLLCQSFYNLPEYTLYPCIQTQWCCEAFLKVLESLSNSTTLIDKVVAVKVIDKGYTTFQYMKTKHLFLERFCLKLINFTWTDSLQKLLKSVGVYGTKKQYFALKSIYLKILLWTMHAPGGTNNIVCESLILVNYDPIYFFLLRNFELRI